MTRSTAVCKIINYLTIIKAVPVHYMFLTVPHAAKKAKYPSVVKLSTGNNISSEYWKWKLLLCVDHHYLNNSEQKTVRGGGCEE